MHSNLEEGMLISIPSSRLLFGAADGARRPSEFSDGLPPGRLISIPSGSKFRAGDLARLALSLRQDAPGTQGLGLGLGIGVVH